MYSRQMLSLCYRYATNKEDAEEIFQQSFYLIYKNIGQLKNPDALSGWIKQVFVNTALQFVNQKRKVYILESWHENEIALDEVNKAISSMELDQLTSLIQKLPNGCREVFNLYVIEGYTHKEIAVKMGISVGTSKSQLHDARKILMNAIVRNERILAKKIS